MNRPSRLDACKGYSWGLVIFAIGFVLVCLFGCGDGTRAYGSTAGYGGAAYNNNAAYNGTGFDVFNPFYDARDPYRFDISRVGAAVIRESLATKGYRDSEEQQAHVREIADLREKLAYWKGRAEGLSERPAEAAAKPDAPAPPETPEPRPLSAVENQDEASAGPEQRERLANHHGPTIAAEAGPPGDGNDGQVEVSWQVERRRHR